MHFLDSEGSTNDIAFKGIQTASLLGPDKCLVTQDYRSQFICICLHCPRIEEKSSWNRL